MLLHNKRHCIGDPHTELDSSEPSFESGMTLSTSPGIPTGHSMQAEGNNEPGVIVGKCIVIMRIVMIKKY